MSHCCKCECNLPANKILCKECYEKWPKGIPTLTEYANIPYKPEPVRFPAGYGTAPDFPE